MNNPDPESEPEQDPAAAQFIEEMLLEEWQGGSIHKATDDNLAVLRRRAAHLTTLIQSISDNANSPAFTPEQVKVMLGELPALRQQLATTKDRITNLEHQKTQRN